MKFGYSMPSTAPLYPEPPFHYENNKSINILFKTAPEILRDLVPAPLTPNPDNLAFIYAGVFNGSQKGIYQKAVYREVGIGVPAFFNGVAGNYMLYVYLDLALGILPGREIWGWPKKDAIVTFEEKDGLYSASVKRGGMEIIRASVNASVRVDPIPEQSSFPSFNLKIIPSVRKDSPPDVLQLTATTGNSLRKELYRGNATLFFASTDEDLLGNLPVIEIIGGEMSIEDMDLGYGNVLYDYLTETS